MEDPSLYEELFAALCQHMGRERPEKTSEITREIKRFFRQYFQQPHHVHCGHENGSEYMTDVLVTSFDPKRLVEDRTLKIVPESVDVYLAVESELGGVGASSAYGVMKNVVEDYVKLLLMRATYRVMIFTRCRTRRNRIMSERESRLFASFIAGLRV